MALFLSEQNLEQQQEKNFVQAINEAYFGRTPGIMRCFSAFCDFRDKYRNSRIIGKGNIHAQNDKLLKVFRHEIEREFGFYSVTIILDQTDLPNMCTTIPAFGVGPDKVIIGPNGYKYKEDAEVCAIFILNVGMIFDEKYSNEECFGLFLHEVGHNFQNSLNRNIIGIRWGVNLLYIGRMVLSAINMEIFDVLRQGVNMLTSSNYFNKVIGPIANTVLVDNKEISTIISAYTYLINIVDSLTRIVRGIIRIPMAPIKLLMSGVMSLANLIINPIGSYYGYVGERFADGFPATYGFALDTSKALFKINDKTLGIVSEKIIDRIPLVSHIYNAMLLPGIILLTTGDEHPLEPARAYSILNDLKTDLKDPNLDPKLKTKLKKEIAEYESEMDKYFAEEKRIGNPNLCRGIVYDFIYHKLKGGIKYQASQAFGKSNFRDITNKTTDDIKNHKYDINNTRIL